jgi:hypothetical protein
MVLYPLGVSSELTMAWLALPDIKRRGLCQPVQKPKLPHCCIRLNPYVILHHT